MQSHNTHSRKKIVTNLLIFVLSVGVLFPRGGRWLEEEKPKMEPTSIMLLGAVVGYFAWNIYNHVFHVEKEKLIPEVKKAILDLQFIATSDEIKALKTLRTPEEVDRFLYYFWKRRDPTPQTEVNEYKLVHMRRVEYANENFTTGLKPGAATDQGRVYILYGEPFSVDRYDFTDDQGFFNNKYTGESYPAEIWYYNFPSMRTTLPTIFNFPDGVTVFAFFDLQKVGEYTQIYSNKPGEYIDVKLVQQLP